MIHNFKIQSDRLHWLLASNSVERFSNDIFNLFDHLGFKGVAIGGLCDGSTIKLISNFNAQYISTYLAEDLYHSDHVIAHCRRHESPVHWQESYDYHSLSKGAQNVINISADFGIKHGLAIPILTKQGRAVVSLDFAGTANELNQLLHHDMPMLIGYCHAVIWKTTRDFAADIFDTPNFTPKEHVCLQYMASGLTNAEIAALQSVSINRVKELVSAILRKLHAANRTEAVMQALQMGLVAP